MAINEIGFNEANSQAMEGKWCKQDTVWMLSLYGTAIGAGTLFLPIGKNKVPQLVPVLYFYQLVQASQVFCP